MRENCWDEEEHRMLEARLKEELERARGELLAGREGVRASAEGIAEEVEVTAAGGRQTKIRSGFHLGFPARGALEVAGVVSEGVEKYGVGNWRLI